MATSFYGRLAVTATDKVRQYGKPGYVLRRPGVPTVPDPDRPWETVPGDPTDYPFSALKSNVTRRHLEDSRVRATDSVLLAPHGDLPTDVGAGDRVYDGSVALEVVTAAETNPGGTGLLWELVVRGG